MELTPLGLELLRHRREDDFTSVNRGEVKCAVLGAKDLRDFGGQKGMALR
jgi:hypothetical protein